MVASNASVTRDTGLMKSPEPVKVSYWATLLFHPWAHLNPNDVFVTKINLSSKSDQSLPQNLREVCKNYPHFELSLERDGWTVDLMSQNTLHSSFLWRHIEKDQDTLTNAGSKRLVDTLWRL